MLNASVGVQRVIGRLRRPRSLESDPAPTAPDPESWLLAQARPAVGCARPLATSPRISRPPRTADAHAGPCRPTSSAPALLARLGPDRVVALAVAVIVLGASVVERLGRGPAKRRGPIGGTTGDGDGPAARGRRRRRSRTRRLDRRVRRLRPTSPTVHDRAIASSASTTLEPDSATPARRRRPARRLADRRQRARSSRTARSSSPSRSTRRSRTARTCSGPTRSRPATR